MQQFSSPAKGENSKRALRMVTEKALIRFILIGKLSSPYASPTTA